MLSGVPPRNAESLQQALLAFDGLGLAAAGCLLVAAGSSPRARPGPQTTSAPAGIPPRSASAPLALAEPR